MVFIVSMNLMMLAWVLSVGGIDGTVGLCERVEMICLLLED